MDLYLSSFTHSSVSLDADGPRIACNVLSLQFIHHCHCLLQDGKTAEDLATAEQQEHVAVLLAKLKKV